MVEISSEMWVGGNFFLKKKRRKEKYQTAQNKTVSCFLVSKQKTKEIDRCSKRN